MAGDVEVTVETMTVGADATIRDALEAINRGGLGTVLVIDGGGRFAGLLTDGDIRRALLSGADLATPVTAVEHPPPKVARVGMNAAEIAAMFTEPVRVVPVLDAEDRVVDLAQFDSRMRLPIAEPLLGDRELQYVSECILTGWISSAGRFVGRFESIFAEFCGSRHAIATSNGTAALHLALLAAGVGPGDEVIVPTLTFIATANAVAYCGATPVPVDSDPETWTISPAAAAAAVTERTKAIVPVHLYGHPADLDPLLELDIPVIEDAAEAHGALYKGRRVGAVGQIGVFSFYGNKIFTTGEGGMVVTDDDALAEQLRMLRDHGMSRDHRYLHPVLGFNYRLTNLQAAVGVAQMERADEVLARKQRTAELYAAALADVPGVTLPPDVNWAHSVHWLYSVLVDEDAFGMSRDVLLAELQVDGIETRPFFVPVHRQPLYDRGASLPVAERLAATGLSLPSAVGLGEREVERVAGALTARVARVAR